VRLQVFAEFVNSAAIPLGRTLCRGWRVVHEGFSFLGGLASGFLTLVGFAVESLGYGCGAAHIAQQQDFHLKVPAFGADLEELAYANFAGRFDGLVAGFDSAKFAGPGGKGARLKKARSPEPLVDADAGHGGGSGVRFQVSGFRCQALASGCWLLAGTCSLLPGALTPYVCSLALLAWLLHYADS
jgi:hypothetical protein